MCEYCGDPTENGHRELPTPNIPKLRKIYDWIVTQNEIKKAYEGGESTEAPEWHQFAWAREIYDAEYNVCGTAYCFAGYALAMEGAFWQKYQIGHVGSQCTLKDGTVVDVQAEATKDLGLTHEEAGWLFNGTNDLVAIYKILGKIWNRAGEDFDLVLPEGVDPDISDSLVFMDPAFRQYGKG